MNEASKTSFLVIAGILTATGAATLPTDVLTGLGLLGGATVILILRGVLKAKGIAIENNKQGDDN